MSSGRHRRLPGGERDRHPAGMNQNVRLTVADRDDGLMAWFADYARAAGLSFNGALTEAWREFRRVHDPDSAHRDTEPQRALLADRPMVGDEPTQVIR
jgi:hypothetical protein